MVPTSRQGLNVAIILLSLNQEIDGFQIAVSSVSGDGFYAGQTDIAYLSEIFPLLHFGDMDFHSWNTHCLHRVQKGNTGVGIGTRIDNDSVDLTVGFLNFIDDTSLVV